MSTAVAAGVSRRAERPHARRQLAEGERLDEVIVGAFVEAGDAVLDAPARREHQDPRQRRATPLGPSGAPSGPAATTMRRHISRPSRSGRLRSRQTTSYSVPARSSERRRTVGGHVDRVSLQPQAVGHGAGQVRLVFHHQDPHHGSTSASVPRRPAAGEFPRCRGLRCCLSRLVRRRPGQRRRSPASTATVKPVASRARAGSSTAGRRRTTGGRRS